MCSCCNNVLVTLTISVSTAQWLEIICKEVCLDCFQCSFSSVFDVLFGTITVRFWDSYKKKNPKKINCVELMAETYINIYQTQNSHTIHCPYLKISFESDMFRLVSWCFKPSQPQRIMSGLRETFMKTYS